PDQFEDYEYFEGKVAFDVPVRASLAGSTPNSPGERPFTFRLAIDYQTCTMERCLLPGKAEFELTAKAIPGDDWKRAAPDPGVGAAADASPFLVEVSTEPATLEPNSTGRIIAKVKRRDGKPLDATDARIDLGKGQNLSLDGPTLAIAEKDGTLTLRRSVK